MNVAGILGTDQERTVYRLVEQAATLLGGPDSAVPQDFMGLFLGRAVAEDLTCYHPSAVADITRAAWEFLATRKVGTPKISLTPPRKGEDGLEGLSVLEIINDNMPFLVEFGARRVDRARDRGALRRAPALRGRTRRGRSALRAFLGDGPPTDAAVRESFIHIHVAPIADNVRRTEIVQALEQVLADVRVCVQDWRPMLARVKEVIDDLKSNPPPLPGDRVAEAIAFLEWLMDNNFVLLGVRDYVAGPQLNVEPVAESGLENLAPARRAPAAAERGGRRHLAGNPRIPQRAQAAHRHQGQHPLARAPARLSEPHRREAFHRGGHARRRVPRRRPLHLDRLYALGRQHSLSAAQGGDRPHPRRI